MYFKTSSTFNVKNDVQQQKKALNKSTRFAVNRQSVSASKNEGLVEIAILLDRKTAFIRISVWKKMKRKVSTSGNKIF